MKALQYHIEILKGGGQMAKTHGNKSDCAIITCIVQLNLRGVGGKTVDAQQPLRVINTSIRVPKKNRNGRVCVRTYVRLDGVSFLEASPANGARAVTTDIGNLAAALRNLSTWRVCSKQQKGTGTD